MNELASAAVRHEIQDGVAVLTIDCPPVNALSEAVRDGLAHGLKRAIADPSTSAIVLIGNGGRFPAGADIREFGTPKRGTPLSEIQAIMEASHKPIVAAMGGHALGGGLELALAAHYRVGTLELKVGLPEINLGLLPGGGGTQRLTRLVGPEQALDLILTGKHISAASALSLGIIDTIVEGDLAASAAEFAIQRARAGGPYPKAIDRRDHMAASTDFFEGKRKANALKWKGQVTPGAIVDCVEAATKLSPSEGLEFEAEAFRKCHDSPQRAALIHLFFAERAAAKVDGISADTRPRRVTSVGVVGAGTMGGGIAMAAANSGIEVILLDANPEALDAGNRKIRLLYSRSVERGSKHREAADRALAKIRSTLDYSELADVDLVIEAALEDMEVKRRIFGELDRSTKPGAILATNTSALDIDRIADVTSRPGDVIGMHFFSPANVMKLLEVVRGEKSSEETIATALAFAKRIAKVPVLAGNADGFIGNRILKVYSREAEYLLEEGATPTEVDKALQDFGFPMGVFLMRDMAGLDVAWRVRQNRIAAGIVKLGERYAPLADRLCEQGRFGQKSGAGYYRYEDGVPVPDPLVEAMLDEISREKGIARRKLEADEIVSRVLTAMVNEGAFIVQEGIAQRASDIDVVYVNGYGFPRYRGGPMFWAEQKGLDDVLAKVRHFERQFGAEWTPAPLLVERAAAGGGWGG